MNCANECRETDPFLWRIHGADVPGILINECIRWSLICEEMNIPSYVYYFCHKLPGPDWNYFHSSELWYMFGTFERCWRPMTEEDRDLSEKMVTYWTDFMKYGAPSPDRKEDWMPCTKGGRYIKRLE